MAMELVKENIECEQLLGENFSDTVVKSEYIIPDTHPDVYEILMLDAKPCIINKEIMQDKVFLEGQIEYNILYLAKEEGECGLYNVTYSSKFSNYVEIAGANTKMLCEADCYIEHMEKMVLNERKVSIEGIIKLKCEVYKKYDFQTIKDVVGVQEVQFLRNPASVDKILGTVSQDLIAKSHMNISMEKPEIGTIIKCDVNVHKKEIKIVEGKVQTSAFALVSVLYRGKNTAEVCYLEEDVFINKESELAGANPYMSYLNDFRVDTMDISVKEDDLGENRIIDIEALVKSMTKVMYKEDMEMIEDAYSPVMMMEMSKKDYGLNVIHGHTMNESVIKGNIELASGASMPKHIILCQGTVCITDKKIVDDKVVVDGLMKVEVLYRTEDEERKLYTVMEEIPFVSNVEIPGAKIDMQCIAKVNLENIEASLEANTIAIKAIIMVFARVNYITHKEFLVDIIPMEGEVPKKKASVTIYVVQAGDTLWKISKRYNTTIDVLARTNGLEDVNIFKVGQKLIIPGRALM